VREKKRGIEREGGDTERERECVVCMREREREREREAMRKSVSQSGVARSKKIKKAKFGHKQFQKGQILKNEKSPNKGQISFKKFVKITKLKFKIS